MSVQKRKKVEEGGGRNVLAPAWAKLGIGCN